MNTLMTAPIAPLLDTLFQQADNASPSSMPSAAGYWNKLTSDDRARLLRSKTDYIDLYSHLKDIPLAISRETGTLLYMLARSMRARSIVEFGTSFGISTLYLAAALRDNGGGHLITSEFEPSKIARARENLTEGGVIDLVDIRQGDALQTLASGLPETIDLLLLDGAKGLYLDILHLLENPMRPGTLIIADNADFCPDYLSYMRDPVNGYLSVPFNNDVELSMRLG